MLQDGKKYYMHEVKEGHTLYSVSKAYNVSQKILSKENPNIPHIASGTLPLGVVIKIPFIEVIESAEQEEKDYNKYNYHVVEPKETLSSLSRKYKIHYKKIIEHNPGVETTLPIGIELRIPKTQVAPVRDSYTVPDTTFIYHTVKNGENTIKLANYYGIKIRDLRTANPGMRWSLNENEIIRIPKNLITNTDIFAVKEPGETPSEIKWETDEISQIKDPIANDTISNISLNKECLEKLRPHTDEVFELAFMVPLYLDINDTLHINDTLPYSAYDIYDVRFIEFMEGAYMAMDSMKSYGLRMNVQVFDTERDPRVVDSLFNTGKLDNCDLIIGPVYSRPVEAASKQALARNIPLVSPLSANGTGLDENPLLFQVNPGAGLQFDLASIFLAEHYDMNMIMVQDTNSLNPVHRKSGNKIFDYLTYKVYPDDLLSGKIKFHPTFAEELPEKAVMAPVEDMLSVGRKNLVMIPSDNEIFVTDIVNKLNALALNYDITVFGRPEWGSFESLELEYLYNLRFQYYTNFTNPYVDYADSLTLDFCRKYRINWHNEPSRFSFQGFDVSYFFFKALYLYGSEFVNCIECWENVLDYKPLQTEFCFHRVKNGKGFENQALSIIKYNIDSLTKEKIRSTQINTRDKIRRPE